jgi:hypothetical protein
VLFPSSLSKKEPSKQPIRNKFQAVFVSEERAVFIFNLEATSEKRATETSVNYNSRRMSVKPEKY